MVKKRNRISFTRCKIVTWQEEIVGLSLKIVLNLKATSDMWLISHDPSKGTTRLTWKFLLQSTL